MYLFGGIFCAAFTQGRVPSRCPADSPGEQAALYLQRMANQHLPLPHRVCEVEFVFSEGSEASGRRVDGLAFVNEDVVGE